MKNAALVSDRVRIFCSGEQYQFSWRKQIRQIVAQLFC